MGEDQYDPRLFDYKRQLLLQILPVSASKSGRCSAARRSAAIVVLNWSPMHVESSPHQKSCSWLEVVLARMPGTGWQHNWTAHSSRRTSFILRICIFQSCYWVLSYTVCNGNAIFHVRDCVILCSLVLDGGQQPVASKLTSTVYCQKIACREFDIFFGSCMRAFNFRRGCMLKCCISRIEVATKLSL